LPALLRVTLVLLTGVACSDTVGGPDKQSSDIGAACFDDRVSRDLQPGARSVRVKPCQTGVEVGWKGWAVGMADHH